MITASQAFMNKVANGEAPSMRMQFIPASGDPFYLSDGDFWAESISFNEATSQSGTFTVGAAVIGEFNFTLNNFGGTLTDEIFAGAKVIPSVYYDINGTPEYLPKGVYYVASHKTNGNLIRVKAYDAMKLLDENKTTITYPTTVQAIVNAICTASGITLATQTIPNGTYSISLAPESDMTDRQLLSAVCEITGNFARMDENGHLYVGWYDFSNPVTIANTFDGKDLWTQPITLTGVRVNAYSGDDTYFYGTDDNVVTVSNNPLVYAGNGQEICNMLGARITGATFRPGSLPILSNPCLQSGDVLEITDNITHDTYLLPITELTYTKGLTETVSCSFENTEDADLRPTIEGLLKKSIDEASAIATQASETAQETEQHFWFTSGTGSEAGAHIAEVPKTTFERRPSGGNTLMRSNGVQIRDGTAVMARFSGDQIRIGQEDVEGYSNVIDSEKWTVVEHKYSGSGTLEGRNIVEVGAVLGSSEESTFWMSDNNFHGTASSASEAHLYLDFNEDVVPDADGSFVFWGRYDDGSAHVFNNRQFQTTKLRYFVDNTVDISSADKTELLEQETDYPYISKVYFSAGITFSAFSCADGVLYETASGKKFILCPQNAVTYYTYSGAYSGGEDKIIADIPTAYTLIEPTSDPGNYSLDLGTWTNEQLNKLRMTIVSDGQGGYKISHFYDYVEPFLVFDQHVPRPKYMLGTRQADMLGDFSFGAGENVNPIGHHSVTIGQNLIASYDDQIIFGKNNESTNNYVLAIGNGTDEETRSNCLEIGWDGSIKSAGEVEDGNGTSISDLLANFTDFFKVKEYPYAYSNLNPGAGLNISATDFGFSRPTGYVPIAFLRTNSGSVNVSVIGVNVQATGSGAAMSIYNHSNAARSYTATIVVLYARASMITTA